MQQGGLIKLYYIDLEHPGWMKLSLRHLYFLLKIQVCTVPLGGKLKNYVHYVMYLCYVLKSLREQLIRGLREGLGDPVCDFLCDSPVGTVLISFGLQTGLLILL